MPVDVRVREHVLAIDYPAGQGRRPRPLEALLASPDGFVASTLNVVLCRQWTRSSIRFTVRAERRAEHPTIPTEIELVYLPGGDALDSRWWTSLRAVL